jgi:hypothetical protein
MNRYESSFKILFATHGRLWHIFTYEDVLLHTCPALTGVSGNLHPNSTTNVLNHNTIRVVQYVISIQSSLHRKHDVPRGEFVLYMAVADHSWPDFFDVEGGRAGLGSLRWI